MPAMHKYAECAQRNVRAAIGSSLAMRNRLYASSEPHPKAFFSGQMKEPPNNSLCAGQWSVH